MNEEVDLADAYSVRTPEDNRDLYSRWATTYDSAFADRHGYTYPVNVAEAYLKAGGSTELVLDVGCGTGLVGSALRERGVRLVHGIDISAAMLAQAADKRCADGSAVYEHLAEADLTKPTSIVEVYSGVVSAGTFTHGHLGPSSLELVLRMVERGGLLGIGVNSLLFDQDGGFGHWMTIAADEGRITDTDTTRVDIYARGSDESDPVAAENAAGTVMLFRKAI